MALKAGVEWSWTVGQAKLKGRNGRLVPPTDEVFLLSSASFASFFRAYLQSNCSYVSPLALALWSRKILIVVVAFPGWPNSRLKVPSSSPASGSRRSGGWQINMFRRGYPSVDGWRCIFLKNRGQGARTLPVVYQYLPIWITEREDVRSNLL